MTVEHLSCILITYQRHQLPDGALDVQVLGRLNADRVLFQAKRRKLNEGAIRLNNLANLIQPSEQDSVDLFRWHGHILYVEADATQQIPQLQLRKLDLTRLIASDEDFAGVPRLSIARTVSEVRRERRWEVDGSPRSRLDQLDVLAVATTDELLDRKLDVCPVNNAAKLCKISNRAMRPLSGSLVCHTH